MFRSVMSPAFSRLPSWPAVIISSFIALALFDAVIVVLAISTRTAVIDEDPYGASQRYEQIIDAKRAVVRDRLVSSISSEQGRVAVVLSGLPRDQELEVKLTLLRPNDADLDLRESLASIGSEFRYISPVLRQGMWLLSIDLRSGLTSYRIGPEKVIVRSYP
ncbi:MAG: hypothetical protein DCC75_13320 [Proteobacteria bacterium]|nr:MAG: hypothetical protein DCC75_13320 [Pseudomonadota bacterium]